MLQTARQRLSDTLLRIDNGPNRVAADPIFQGHTHRSLIPRTAPVITGIPKLLSSQINAFKSPPLSREHVKSTVTLDSFTLPADHVQAEVISQTGGRVVELQGGETH